MKDLRIQSVLGSKDVRDFKRYNVVIMSYAIASKTSNASFLATRDWTALVCDEAHYLKNRYAKRTKIVLGLLWDRTKYRICLSGTPFVQSLVDGFPVFNKMAPDLFPQFEAFGERYTHKRVTPWGIQYSGSKNADELSQKIRSRFFIRYTKEQVLPDLPEKTFSEILLPEEYSVKSPKELEPQIKHEIELAVQAINEGRAAVVPKIPHLAEQRRLQGELKVPAVAEFVESILDGAEPVVLFAYHRSVIASLAETLKDYKPVLIHGEVSHVDRAKAVESFQSGKTNLFIGQLTAAGVGITLTRASICVLAEIDYSPQAISQAIARVHRIGTMKPVTIYYFLAKGGVDNNLVRVAMNKARDFQTVLKDEIAVKECG
jgi:SWI/SNF-related matrix-associated actin-dependent regulator 1 of chromatin subfamily A